MGMLRSRISGCKLLTGAPRQLLSSPSSGGHPAGRPSTPPARWSAVVPHIVDGGTDAEIARQALGQEQAVFDRKMKKDRDLFRLQLAMGWTTFLMLPISIAAIAFYPPAAAGLVPLNGLAAWNWRRMLRRDGDEIEVTTKLPKITQ
jgi:hypothetical protein